MASEKIVSKEQETLVRKWAAEGMSVGKIQNELKEIGVPMTYMEVRFLLDDLGVEIQDPVKPPTAAAAPAGGIGETAPQKNEIPQGGVSVTIDAITHPGAALSGEVNFTDGTKAGWALDQQGRLGLMNAPKGYHPSVTDLEDFQSKLRAMIEQRGGL